MGDWVSREGTPLDAERWVARLLAAFGRLDAFPERCPVAPDDVVLDTPLPHLILGPYRTLFTVKGRVVFVLHIRHGRRPLARKEELSSALEELDPLPE